MSFHQRANRLLLLPLPVALAAAIPAALSPMLAEIVGHSVVLGTIWSLIAFGAGGGVALPVISALLDRRRPGSEPQGKRIRGVALAVAAVSVGLGVLGGVGGEGLMRLAGFALALAALAAGLLVFRHRPPGTLAGSPGFHATVFGVVQFLIAFVLLPGFTDTRERAYENAMKSDLRNLASAQAMFFDSTGRYDADPLGDGRFVPSRGVELRFEPTVDGWTAVATHRAVDGQCAIFEGDTPIAPATEPASVACDTDRASAAGIIASGLSATLLASGVVLLLIGLGAGRARGPGATVRST